MSKLRKEFEETHSIKLMLIKPYPVYFNEENNMYMGGCDEDYYWVNGAWFMFQELGK